MPAKKQTKDSAHTKPADIISSFESEFERLGTIVERLETGSISLEEMLNLYEEGVGLAGKLSTLLTQAELRIEKLAEVHEELTAGAGDSGDEIESYLLE